jgi:hypothetical protein
MIKSIRLPYAKVAIKASENLEETAKILKELLKNKRYDRYYLKIIQELEETKAALMLFV